MTSVKEEAPSATEPAPADGQTRRPRSLTRKETDVHVRELAGWERGVAEHHAEEVPKCPVLHPEHHFRKKWDLAQIFALIYVAFLVPCMFSSPTRLLPTSHAAGVACAPRARSTRTADPLCAARGRGSSHWLRY